MRLFKSLVMISQSVWHRRPLAYEVTKLVHGQSNSADAVVRVTDVLFGSSDYSLLKSEDFVVLKTDLP